MTGKNETARESADRADTFWQPLERFSNTWTFDILVRFLYGGWFLFAMWRLLSSLDLYIEAHRY